MNSNSKNVLLHCVCCALTSSSALLLSPLSPLSELWHSRVNEFFSGKLLAITVIWQVGSSNLPT